MGLVPSVAGCGAGVELPCTPCSADGRCASDSGQFFATYQPNNAVIADARDAFSTWLADAAPATSVCEEMLVVLSELLANAFAAGRDDHSAVAVRAWVDGDLTLEVTNPADAAFDPGARGVRDEPGGCGDTERFEPQADEDTGAAGELEGGEGGEVAVGADPDDAWGPAHGRVAHGTSRTWVDRHSERHAREFRPRPLARSVRSVARPPDVYGEFVGRLPTCRAAG